MVAQVTRPEMKNRRRSTAGKADRTARQQAAAELAVAALAFIAGEPDELGRFLALSGIGPESIRVAAREPGFLLGVLDHLVGDARLLPRLPARRAGGGHPLPGLRIAAAAAPRGAPHAHDRACGLRRLLCHDREARRRDTRRQA